MSRTHGGAVFWRTTLQAGRSRVRYPRVYNGIFQWHNPSSRTMGVGSTQEYFPGVMGAGAQVWQPYHLYVHIVLKYGSLNLLSRTSCPTTTWETFLSLWPSVTYILTRLYQSIYVTRYNLIEKCDVCSSFGHHSMCKTYCIS